MTKEEREEQLRQKAKAMRYKHPVASCMSLEYIRSQLSEMLESMADAIWSMDADRELIDVLTGDEEDAQELKMALIGLDADLERFGNDVFYDAWVPECFDELFPAVHAGGSLGGYSGFDEYEDDYFGLEPFEYGIAEKTAEKKILRLTKSELLEAVGGCLKVYSSFVALKYRYDCLDASLQIIRGKNIGLLKLAESIDEQYGKAERESSHFQYNCKEVRELDGLVAQLPPECWLY